MVLIKFAVVGKMIIKEKTYCMKRYQLYLFFLFFVISSNLSSAQTKLIQLQLDGKKYETMYLKANLYGLNKQSVEVKGQPELDLTI